MAEAAVAERARPSAQGRLLTGEAGLYLLLFGIGAVLRLWALGEAPLSPAEAGVAYPAWRLSEGLEMGSRVASPLLLHAQAGVFLVLGSGDSLARLLPAAIGSVMVLLPYLVRRELGRDPALWTAGLLAVSPTLIHASRQLDGQIVVAAAGLALWIGAGRWERDRDRRGLWLVAGSVGVGLAAGREMYLILLVFVAYAAFGALVRSYRNGVAREISGWMQRLPSRLDAQAALALAGGLFLSLATGLLSRPAGLQDAWDLMPVLGAPVSPELLPNRLGLLWWYEPVLLVAGVAGAVLLRERPLIRFAGFWVVGAFVLQGPLGASVAGLPLMAVPLAILAGSLLAWLAGNWTVTGPSAAGSGRGAVVTALGGLMVLGVLMLRTGAQLNYGAPSAGEPLLRTVTSADLRNLAADVRTASLQRTAEPDRIGVGLTLDEPALLWYLRSFPLTLGEEGFPAGSLPEAVVSEDTLEAEGYLGQRYRLEETWRAPGPWTAGQLLAWYRLGDPPVAPDPRDIILWIRTPETS